MNKRLMLRMLVSMLIMVHLPLSAAANGTDSSVAVLDKDADPVPVVSSGSFTCDTWIHTSMDSFSVTGGELADASWGFGRGYVGYNLSGTFRPGEALSISIAGTMGEMGYQMEHQGNDLLMRAKCFDASGKEIQDLTELVQIDDSTSASLSDTVALTVPDGVEKVELYGSFTCSWRTPYSAASELVAVNVSLERGESSETEAEPTPVPATTTERESAINVMEGGRDVVEALTRLHEWSMSYNWTPDMIKESQESVSIVKFGGLTGEVWVLPAGAQDMDELIFAELGTPLHHGDVVITTGHGGAILSFSDMSSLVIKPGAIAQLDIKNDQQSKIGLLAGTVWVNLQKMIQGGSMEVEMGHVVAGIKGTILAASVTEDGEEVYLFTSSAQITSKENGDTVTLKPGQKASMDQTGNLQVSAFDIEDQAEAFEIAISDLEADGYREGSSHGLLWALLIVAVVSAAIAVTLYLRRN